MVTKTAWAQQNLKENEKMKETKRQEEHKREKRKEEKMKNRKRGRKSEKGDGEYFKSINYKQSWL
jgi:hypothetical protein